MPADWHWQMQAKRRRRRDVIAAAPNRIQQT
jgi:hypothetical protein